MTMVWCWKSAYQSIRSLLCAFLMIILISYWAISESSAANEPASGDTAVTMTLKDHLVPAIAGVSINSKTNTAGEDFYASLAYPLTYEGRILPEGTEFFGHVQELSSSHAWGHPGQITIWLDKVIFPDGGVFHIYPAEQPFPHLQVMHHDMGKNSELSRQFKSFFLNPSKLPEANIYAGQTIYFKFNPATLKGLFMAASQPNSGSINDSKSNEKVFPTVKDIITPSTHKDTP